MLCSQVDDSVVPLGATLTVLDRTKFTLTKDNIMGAKLAIPFEFFGLEPAESAPVWGYALAAPPHLRFTHHAPPSQCV